MITLKILKYQLKDLLNSKFVIFYGVFFLIATEALFDLGGNPVKTALSMMSIVLMIVPLFSIIVGVMYLYNSREFVELMLSQPIKRSQLFWGMYGGLTISLITGFLIGMTLPFLWHGVVNVQGWNYWLVLLSMGVILTLIFVALSFWVALIFEDRLKGLSGVIVLWLLFGVVYDGLILFLVYTFSNYNMQKPVIALTMLNPMDLARVIMLLKFDVSTLMGYTGATLQAFFGKIIGIVISSGAMLVWWVLPLFGGFRRFVKKDF